MGYKAPTIEEEGGLQAHVEKRGIDFKLFKRLIKQRLPDATIGKAIAPNPDKPIVGRTIKNWRIRLERDA